MEDSVLGRNRHVVDLGLRVVMLDAAAAQNVYAGALDSGKNQVGKIYDLSDDDWVALWASAKLIAKHMDDVTGRRTIMKVVGVDLPDHAHIHLIPYDETWEDDKTIKMRDEEFEEIREKLAF